MIFDKEAEKVKDAKKKYDKRKEKPLSSRGHEKSRNKREHSEDSDSEGDRKRVKKSKDFFVWVFDCTM